MQIEFHGAHIKWSDATDGNLGHHPFDPDHGEACCGEPLRDRWSQFHSHGWLRLKQVHGNNVVVANDVREFAGAPADAAITNKFNVALGIATADCAPIALVSDEGIIGAMHAGWRGLAAGVVAETASKMRGMGATRLYAALGPCIHEECYEFLGDDLTMLSQRFGEGVVGKTSNGSTALNMIAAVSAACIASDVDLQYISDDCTAHSGKHFSFRAKKDDARQVMLVWKEAQ